MIATPKRVLLLANPKSGRAATGLDGVRTILAEAGIAVTHRPTESADALDAAIRREAEAYDAVALAGGDGTVNAAAAALKATRVPVALLPFGTANDLARSLAIPIGAPAARLLFEGRTRRIDLGHVNDHLFVNAASIGLPVWVARRQTAELKRRLKVLSYPIAAVQALRDTHRFRATITVDGVATRVKVVQITVGNGVNFGGGLRLGRDAALDDGLLDVFAIEADSFGDLVRAGIAIRFGRQDLDPLTHTFRGRTVRIETHTPHAVNTDGEVTTTTPADFHVDAGVLTIFVPR
ncbi:lipid kinase [Segnochrobactrum spirostomi]|uniref:Lipid kinase n=1 Tax=Segnochrobactrum spirostomi TaxID=2608987 RepID=A0A6A7Y2U8_9HYPH|nr:lipid kinase [Segnochrobactrum spirostomi]MQT13413.1 lipid kinase [Segnochrobactrum spirostomi]